MCGKLFVAACSQDEVPRLRELLERGIQNGLQGLQWLEAEAMREIEPHVAKEASPGVRVPEEGIVDYDQVCRKLRSLVEQTGHGSPQLSRASVASVR